MQNKSSTLHPLLKDRQAQSKPTVPPGSPVGPRLRRPKTERQRVVLSTRKADFLPANELERSIADHLLAFECGTFSKRTADKKLDNLRRFQWFIHKRGFAFCDVDALRAYFVYLNRSHEEPEGRWDNGRPAKPLRPATVDTHYRVLSTFFNWLVGEERIIASPMAKVTKPKVPDDRIQPFSVEQVEAILGAASRSRYPKRDYSIVSLFYDTGLRASELAGLRLGDINWEQRSLDVLGKGNKRRVVIASEPVMKALAAHLQQDGIPLDELSNEECLFVSQRGTQAGEPMNRNALYKLVRRLGKEAGIKNVRCSPHTFRHSYALASLQQGRDTFSLQRSLGHSSLKMTSRYVAQSDADLKRAHDLTSPMMALKKRKRER